MMSKNKTGRTAGLIVYLYTELLEMIVFHRIDSGLVLKSDVISNKSNELCICRFI